MEALGERLLEWMRRAALALPVTGGGPATGRKKPLALAIQRRRALTKLKELLNAGLKDAAFFLWRQVEVERAIRRCGADIGSS